MPNDTANVSFNCKHCGAKLTWLDNATDDTEISCSKCGERFGTYADLRHTAIESLRDELERRMKDGLKGL